MQSNKVEYIKAAGLYCTKHGIKVDFCIPEFSSSKIIEHCFHIKNDKYESGIGYEMIIGRDLMVQLGLMSDLKSQVLQWYGVTVPMKEPRGLIGKSDLNKRQMRKVVMHTA